MSPAEVHDVGVVISLNVALQHVDKQLLLLTQYHNPLEKTVCLKQKICAKHANFIHKWGKGAIIILEQHN